MDDSLTDSEHAHPAPAHVPHRSTALACAISLVIGAMVGALAMGARHPAAAPDPTDTTSQPIRVTAAVSEQPSGVAYRLRGTVIAPATTSLMPGGTATGPRVVTGHVAAVGDTFGPLDIVGEVANQPVFAFPSGTPLFRDLTAGETGSDVVAVQRVLIDAGLLVGPTTGTVDTKTQNAFVKLFNNAGYKVPRSASPLVDSGPRPIWSPPMLPVADTAVLPDGAAPVTAVAQVGQALDADTNPLVTLQTAPASITSQVDAAQSGVFPAGTPVLVTIDGAAPAPSDVVTVSARSNDGTPGYDLTIALPDGVGAATAVGEPVTITAADQPPAALAVPLLAIRTDNGGTYVQVAGPDASAPDQRVAVTVTGQANGYAILAASPDLPIGTDVVLSGVRL
jgi:hypothetical protein